MAPHRRHAFTLLILLACSSPPAFTAEWSITPSVNLRQEYNDNIRLTHRPHDSVWGTKLTPRLELRRATEIWDVSANGRVRSAWYHGQDGLDTTDSFLDGAIKRRFERGSWDIRASLANDTTLQDETVDLDTGLTTAQIDRTQKSIALSSQYMFNEISWLQASLEYRQVTYDDGERYGLLDYDYAMPSLQIVHQLTPKAQIYSTLVYSKVDYDVSSALESETSSLSIGTKYNINKLWTVNGSIGARRTDTSQFVLDAVPRPGFEALYPLIFDVVSLPRDSSTTGVVYDASLSRKLETSTLTLSASQSINPSSTGTDTESTSATLSGNHQFTAKLSGYLAVNFLRSTTVGDIDTRNDYTRMRISPSLSWRIDRGFILDTGYTYTRIKRETSNNTETDSNVAYISINYVWPKIATSR